MLLIRGFAHFDLHIFLQRIYVPLLLPLCDVVFVPFFAARLLGAVWQATYYQRTVYVRYSMHAYLLLRALWAVLSISVRYLINLHNEIRDSRYLIGTELTNRPSARAVPVAPPAIAAAPEIAAAPTVDAVPEIAPAQSPELSTQDNTHKAKAEAELDEYKDQLQGLRQEHQKLEADSAQLEEAKEVNQDLVVQAQLEMPGAEFPAEPQENDTAAAEVKDEQDSAVQSEEA